MSPTNNSSLLAAFISQDNSPGWGTLYFLGQNADTNKVSLLIVASAYVVAVTMDLVREIWTEDKVIDWTWREVAGSEPMASLQVELQLDAKVDSPINYLFANAGRISRFLDKQIG